MISVYDVVPEGPAIEVFQLNKCYEEDQSPMKANLGIGAYKTNDGQSWVLPVVRLVETAISNDATLDHEYLPILGDRDFCQAACKLILGRTSPVLREERAFGVQTLSGTGALSVGAAFLARVLQRTVFYVSDPSWDNHERIFLHAGFKKVKRYKYWDERNRKFDFESTLKTLSEAPAGAVIIFQAQAHNPTGADPTHGQWKKLADMVFHRKLFPFFDCAYQGVATGDADRDAFAVRHFADRGFELMCAQSFAKNFGLYNERIGNLCVVQKSRDTTMAVKSQLAIIIRGMYSTPPAHGSRIVKRILTDSELCKEWINCTKIMSSRIMDIRQQLCTHLTKLSTPGVWNHIIEQIGMFCYTGLTEAQVRILITHYHIYMMRNGRINMCAVNENNVEYIAKSFNAAIKKSP